MQGMHEDDDIGRIGYESAVNVNVFVNPMLGKIRRSGRGCEGDIQERGSKTRSIDAKQLRASIGYIDACDEDVRLQFFECESGNVFAEDRFDGGAESICIVFAAQHSSTETRKYSMPVDGKKVGKDRVAVLFERLTQGL